MKRSVYSFMTTMIPAKNINFTCALALILMMATFQASATKVGIIVGSLNAESSPSNAEKMCILKNLSTTARQSSQDLDFVFVQNKRSAKGTADAVMELLVRDVDIVLLPLISKEAQVASRILTQFNTPFVTSASSTEVIKDHKLGLSIMPSNRIQAELLARYFIKSHKQDSIHILRNSGDQYSSTIASQFVHALMKLNPDIKVHNSNYKSTTINGFMDTLKDGDVVFAPLFNPHIAMVYTAAVSSQKQITIIGTDSVGGRSEFYDVVEEFSDKVNLQFVKNWNGEVKGPNSRDLRAYVKAFCPKEKNTFLTTYSYDLLRFVIDESSRLNKLTEKSDAINVLRSSGYISTMDGSSMSFDEAGYNYKPMYLYKITSNGNQLIQTLKFDEGIK